MTELRVVVPDEVAQALAEEAAQKGSTTEDLAAEVLVLHVPQRPDDGLGFIGLPHARPGFSARRCEELLEAEGFV
jgi:hypothetical protein